MAKQFRQTRWCFVLLLAASIVVPYVAEAQEYPVKPITLVNPGGAGGSTDLLMRAVISVSSSYLEQPIVLDLKPGGSGAVGTDFVAKAAPDGYTLLCGGPGWNSTLPAIEGRSKGPEYFDAVCRINYNSSFTLVRSESPFKTLNEAIQWAKANPNKLVFGNTGVWGAADLCWKIVRHQTGIVTRDVPHEGGGPFIVALLGGHVDIGITGPPISLPHIQAGKLRALAYNDNKRLAQAPNVPTAKEQGIDVIDHFWRSILVPKGTPPSVINKLAAAFKKITEDPSFVEMIKKFGEEVNYLGPEEFTKMWKEEYESRKQLAKLYKK